MKLKIFYCFFLLLILPLAFSRCSGCVDDSATVVDDSISFTGFSSNSIGSNTYESNDPSTNFNVTISIPDFTLNPSDVTVTVRLTCAFSGSKDFPVTMTEVPSRGLEGSFNESGSFCISSTGQKEAATWQVIVTRNNRFDEFTADIHGTYSK